MNAAKAFLSNGRLDRLAIGLSGLCAVHCIATAVLLGILASAGTFLENPIIHEIGLVLALLFGAIALGVGFRAHGQRTPLLIGGLGLVIMAIAMTMSHGLGEAGLTLIGVTILSLGHVRNWRAHPHRHAA